MEDPSEGSELVIGYLHGNQKYVKSIILMTNSGSIERLNLHPDKQGRPPIGTETEQSNKPFRPCDSVCRAPC
jgi:hypothetical protein